MHGATASLVLAITAWPMMAMAAMQFINPPPFGDGDVSKNQVFAEGSTVTVSWTAGVEGKASSLALFQLNGTQYTQPFEYITQSVINVTSFTWLVGTSKNLTFSNMFYLCIFQEGSTTSDSNSHYFNISSKATETTSAKTSTTAKVGSTLLPATTTSAPLASDSVPASNGLSSEAKVGLGVGLGVGIPAAIAIGIGLGWFCLGRRSEKAQAQAQTQAQAQVQDPAPHMQQASYYSNGGYYSEVPQGAYAPQYGPTEMPQGQPMDPNKYYSSQPAQELPAEQYTQSNPPQELVASSPAPHSTTPHS